MNDMVVVEQKLGLIQAASRALAEAQTIEETKSIRAGMEAVRAYARQRGDCFDVQQAAAEMSLRAFRRMGQLIPEFVQRGGDRKSNSYRTSLKELGVTWDESAGSQAVAAIPEAGFESHLAESKQSREEITTAAALRLAKQFRPSRNGGTPPPADPCTVDDLQKLIDLGVKFGTVYADPPWQYGNQGTRAATDNHYRTMTVDDIAALPVKELAAPASHLHLWTTNAFLFESRTILEAWGFEYKGVFVWVKPQMGLGNYWRVSHEFLVLGVRGGITFADNSQMSWLRADRLEHSVKPYAIRLLIEKVSPGPNRLEMFGREDVPGWIVWGNQIERGLFGSHLEHLQPQETVCE